jgi:hypothetical protein
MLSLLGPNILRNTLFSEYPQPMFLPQCEWPSFTPIQYNRQNYIYILIFKFLDNKLEAKHSASNDFSLLLISSRMEFWYVKVVPKYLNFPSFQRNYYQFSYHDFVLHSDLETWPCT